MIGLLMAMLWLNDSGAGYNQLSTAAPAYLPAADRCRWERLRAARMLYRGQHRQWFLEEGRTQFNFPFEEIEGRRIQRYITLNACRLMSNTTADLMFGARPKIDAPSGAQRDRVDELVRRSILHARLHEAAVQMSWAGGAFLEVIVWNGQVWIETARANEIYPQGPLMPDGQYASYVRYATTEVPGPGVTTQKLLLTTIYERGSIRRVLYRLSERLSIESDPLPMDQWPAFAAAAPPSEQRTGIDGCSLIYLPNRVGDCEETSDYDGLLEFQDSLNAKFAQLARVLAQHADPKLAMPEAAADPSGAVPATHNVFFFRSKEEIPQYITWSAELDAAMRDRDAAINAFCAGAEMSPVLLGIRQGATPDAARKLRLEATKDLAKTNRKALVVQPAIALAIETALRMDQATPLRRSYPVEPVGVEMRDGLPIDELDRATVIATLRPGKNASLESAVEMRVEDPDAAATEVARIREEDAAAMPTVLSPLGGVEPGELTTESTEGTEVAA